MDNLLELTCVPVITAIVYAVMAIYKHVVSGRNETLTRIIPLWAAILGAVLGIYGYFRVPTLMLGTNLFVAMIVGLAAGLASVGIHQIGKQLSKSDKCNKDVKKQENSNSEMDV